MQSFSYSYNAAAYTRASKDDADSNTIENQFELINHFVKSKPDIKIISEHSDNGYSGVDFSRPSFIKMIKEAEDGKINCIIIKDLSRLGRNYIEVGELMKDILPKLKVRLIAINDNYDSNNPKNDSDEFIIPFRNLINEQYARDTSIKIRSNLDMKRKQGDFVSPHFPYGYKRDEFNKHRLVIDENAAKIVRDIFNMKMSGMSQSKIADRLNEIGELSPVEYKKKQKINFNTTFQKKDRALWSAVSIGRILTNPIYIGTMVQGKRTTPNYKIKKDIMKAQNEWNVVEDTHKAIIKKTDFYIVNKILKKDTRTPPKQSTVLPLSGLIFCGNCGNNMVRIKVGKYNYYICATYKAKKGCSSHSCSANEIDMAVMQTIINQIAVILDFEKCFDDLANLPYQEFNLQKVNTQISEREHEINDCERYKRSLYEDYKDGDISKEDYVAFGKDYDNRIEELNKSIQILKHESELLLNGNNNKKWIEHFKQYKNVSELSRQLVVNLINRITLFDKKQITISFNYEDKFKIIENLLQERILQKGGIHNEA